MKAKSFFAILVITGTIYNELSAQSISDINSHKNSGYWNLSYSIGIGKDLYPNGYIQTPSNGFTYSIDASYTPEKNIGFFANYSSTDLTGKINDLFRYGGTINTQYNFTEFSVGPRIFSNDKIFFIDAGLGYYNVTGRRFIGINAGAGAKIKFSDSYGILLSGRIHNTFIKNGEFSSAFNKRESFVYYGVYLGLELNNRRDKSTIDKRKNRFSFAALGGSVNSGLSFRSAGSAFGAEILYDASSKVSLLLDYLHSNSQNTYDYGWYKEKVSSSGNDFYAGLRFYLTGNDFKIFFENSANMYFSDISSEYATSEINTYKSSTTMNYFGVNFGAGVDFKLMDNLSGLFKVNVGTYVTKGAYYSGILGGLKYGF